MSIKDSGARREFEGGSVRDIQEGKGRMDLIPIREVSEFLEAAEYRRPTGTFLSNIAAFTEDLDTAHIYDALIIFIREASWDPYTAVINLSIHYEEGAKKYEENNWRKVGGGIPAHCYLDSGLRHYMKFKRGDDDENHNSAVLWNFLGLIYTLRNIPDKDDLDFYREAKAVREAKISGKASAKEPRDEMTWILENLKIWASA